MWHPPSSHTSAQHPAMFDAPSPQHDQHALPCSYPSVSFDCVTKTRSQVRATLQTDPMAAYDMELDEESEAVQLFTALCETARTARTAA